MSSKLKAITKKNISCPVCDDGNYDILGVRGNREYPGAINEDVHVFTNVVECKKCGFIYTNPMLVGAEYLENEHYDNPQVYIASSTEDVGGMYQKRINFIKEFKSNTTLLDIGAGMGEFLVETIRNGFDSDGIEPSPKFCEYAKEKLNINIFNGLLSSCEELKNKKYDVITMNHVLEHVDKPNELLIEIQSYLNPNGILFIEVPNTQSLLLKIADIFYKIKGLNWSTRLSPMHPPFHKYGYNPKSMKYILQKNGFKILKLKTLTGLDRGYNSENVSSVINFVRNFVVRCVDLLGNRELLLVIATPNEK